MDVMSSAMKYDTANVLKRGKAFILEGDSSRIHILFCSDRLLKPNANIRIERLHIRTHERAAVQRTQPLMER